MATLDYEYAPNRSGYVLLRFCLVTLLGAWAMLAFCYAADQLAMMYPHYVSISDTNVLFVFPLLLGGTCMMFLRKLPLAQRIAWSVGSMTLGTILGEILIVLVYSSLHTSIQNTPIAR